MTKQYQHEEEAFFYRSAQTTSLLVVDSQKNHTTSRRYLLAFQKMYYLLALLLSSLNVGRLAFEIEFLSPSFIFAQPSPPGRLEPALNMCVLSFLFPLLTGKRN